MTLKSFQAETGDKQPLVLNWTAVAFFAAVHALALTLQKICS